MTTPLGSDVPRVDGRLKVTGAARYSADHSEDHWAGRLAYAHVVLSTVARGSIRSMDVDAARGAPGVLAVYTPFVTAQPQGPGQRGQHLLRRLGAGSPFQLDVVVDRRTGQLGHLVTTQTGDPTAWAGRQADVPRPDPVPARLEEGTQLDEVHLRNCAGYLPVQPGESAPW